MTFAGPRDDVMMLAMAVDAVVVRQRVEDLDAAVPFLLFAGPDEAVQRVAGVAATLAVADLNAAVEEAGGAEIVMPVQPTPNGRRAVLRHPGGGVFEYVGP
ncbi:VOC family protein [Streptomyces sp. NPDC089915]|uniref:VOC family protein n=1 Tax=Streptomyces sp. NPDC089915 TaxID=3155186 RepID=UPI0034249860